MLAKVPGTVIRWPTSASIGACAAAARSAAVVIGVVPMKPWTLIAVHVRCDSLVTVPRMTIGPCSGT
jgi:hypothetical protein